jgi:membrane protein
MRFRVALSKTRAASWRRSVGAAGSLITMLIWVYYAAQIVLFGAEFTRVYAQERGTAFVRQSMPFASIERKSSCDR